ncbi:MAG: hypothetical protein ACLFMS_08265 [Halorhodospira sp.]
MKRAPGNWAPSAEARLGLVRRFISAGFWEQDLRSSSLTVDAQLLALYGYASDGAFNSAFDWDLSIWRKRVVPEDLSWVETRFQEAR